nr:patched domain-containing protein 3-like [Procambarus clarkii]
MGHCLKKFEHVLRNSFYRLGHTVALYYGYFILVPLFITALLATGFQRIKYEDDPEYLFSPRSGYAKYERSVVEDNFSLNFTSNFNPSRITRMGRFARFIIMAKDERTILRSEVWNDIVSLDRLVHSVSVVNNDKVVRYDDLCAVWDSECYENNVLGLQDLMPGVENGTFNLTYPIMLNPNNFETYVFPFFFGGATVNNDSVIEEVEALSLFYWLRTNNAKEDSAGALWEDAILKAVGDRDFGSITVARFVSRTLELELDKNSNSVTPFFGGTVLIMVLFSVSSAMAGDWVRTKPWLGLLGIVSVSLSCVAAFGFLIYLGLEFIGINMAGPFLMLGIGMDDVFVMLAAWRRTRLQDSVPERMGQAFSDAAVGITITTVTDVISFFVGAITPFPSVQIFSIYTGMAVVVAYIWHISFFGGCLAFSGYMEKDQRHGVTCRKIKSKSEAADASCCYRFLCTGGISEADPWNQKDNKEHIVMVFFRDQVASFLNIPAVKAVVIVLFLVYLGVAFWGCTMLDEGLERRRLSRDDSYSVEFYEREDKYFREFPYRVQVVITGDLNYSDPETQKDLMALHKEFESTPYSIGSLYTESWLRAWLGFVERNKDFLDINITSEEDFCAELKELYLSGPANLFAEDVKFNENQTRIEASRFIVQAYKVLDGNADKDMMETFRKVASESKFNVTVYNLFFVYFDQFTMVRSTSIENICLTAVIMMAVSLVFIPNALCCLWVVFSITSVEIGVVGYMAFWGVSLDSISMINLIICIGFSVDFSAHIAHAYLVSKGETPDERVRDCLYTLGLPILQGGLSTILGVTALSLAPSYIFITFFKTVFLVILFGVLHGLVLLPVLLSVLGPISCSKEKPKEDTELSATNCQPTHVHGQEISLSGPSLRIPRPRSVTAMTTSESAVEVEPEVMDQPGSTNNIEKDLGLGTSSDDSSESSVSKEVAIWRGVSDIVTDSRIRSEPPILKTFSNKGYVSDGAEAEKHHVHKRLDRYGEWEDPRRSHQGPRRSHQGPRQNYQGQCPSADYSPTRRHDSSHAPEDRPRHSRSRDRGMHRSASSAEQYESHTPSKPSGRHRDRR